MKKIINTRKTYSHVLTNKYDHNKLYINEFYMRMLIEDINMMVLPTLHNKKYEIYLQNGSKIDEDTISQGLSDTEYYRDMQDSIEDFFKTVIPTMLNYGKAYYEITYFKEKENEKWNKFKLSYIPPFTIKKEQNRYTQTIYENNKKKYINVDGEDILECSFPQNFYKDYMQIVNSLSNLKSVPPSFALPFHNRTEKIPFDVNMHFDSQHLVLANATRKIGWDARNLFEKNITEYYFMYRFLNFQKFLAILRNHVLKELNLLIQRVNKKIEIKGQIAFRNFPDIDNVNLFLEDIQNGKRNFKDIIDFFYGTG